MSDPYLGEIRMISFSFAPQGWALCDGQILPVQQNVNLFSLLGAFYGGDGSSTFALPDLRGRSPRKGGSGVSDLGVSGGDEAVTLTLAQIPQHNHSFRAQNVPSATGIPNGAFVAAGATVDIFGDPSPPTEGMAEGSIQPQGGGQAHSNMQPYIALNFCIALQGTFPAQA